MKVFLGLLLLGGLARAAVDELEATPVVPESQKSDLLITANGNTIKLNTDGQVISSSEARFQGGPHVARRTSSTNEDDDEDSGPTPEEVGTLVSRLEYLRDHAEDDKVVLTVAQVKEIIEVLESYQEDLEEAEEDEEDDVWSDIPDDEQTEPTEEDRRRKRSRRMRGHHGRYNRSVHGHRHHRLARRQAVVHHSHFHHHSLSGSQRIVVNP